MKQLVCEMCGGTDIIKEDGLFVCQICGVKYSLEEARKMLSEEVIAIEGTVKLDESDELSNLYELARRAKSSDNMEHALKYYDMILIKDPNSWEAEFYSVYYKAMGCTIAEIAVSAQSVTNCFPNVLNLLKNNCSDEEISKNLVEIETKTENLALLLAKASETHFQGINWKVANKFFKDYMFAQASVSSMCFTLGDLIESTFDEGFIQHAINAWLFAVKHPGGFKTDYVQKYHDKIKKYDNEYETDVERIKRQFAEKKEKKQRDKGKKKRNGLLGNVLYSRYCPNCGFKNDKNNTFCTECGTNLKEG